jgi:hypothetical protein
MFELRRLADDDRPGADDEDGGYVGAAGHLFSKNMFDEQF